ncbi:MAG: hypothetical protein KDF25_03805, partial [Burkholderiaceae bacterium]|nr:hypothetical protein [Burkholderiaceae bacterium]
MTSASCRESALLNQIELYSQEGLSRLKDHRLPARGSLGSTWPYALKAWKGERNVPCFDPAQLSVGLRCRLFRKGLCFLAAPTFGNVFTARQRNMGPLMHAQANILVVDDSPENLQVISA